MINLKTGVKTKKILKKLKKINKNNKKKISTPLKNYKNKEMTKS